MKYQENNEQKNLLNLFLAEHNVAFTEDILNKLYDFSNLVIETKIFGNLISPKDSEKFLSRHIADSLIPYVYMEKILVDENKEANIDGMNWADMGAGAGCPVFPLAIVMPHVNFFAVEPRTKRVQFMEYVKEKLSLKNMTVVGKRFETSGLAYMDFISCRALSTFENDWERAQPGLKGKGIFATLKSFNNIEHLQNDPAIHIYKYNLPKEEQTYALVVRGNK